MKTMSCKDVGKDCGFVARGNTDDEVIKKLREHGAKSHGMKASDFTPELIKKVKAAIHEEPMRKTA